MAEHPTHTDENSPFCGNCGYSFEGLVDSSRCPECGRPIVEVLQRASHSIGKRYNSKTRVFGMPLISIASGPHGKEKHGHAKGIIAIGDVATGWLAIGGTARGIFCIGGFCIGVMSVGGVSVGLLLCLSGLAVGGITYGGVGGGVYATGGLAAGIIADGGMSYGYYARGGLVRGKYVVTPRQQDQEAVALFRATDLNINGLSMRIISKVHIYGLITAFLLAVALFLVVLYATRGSPRDNPSS